MASLLWGILSLSALLGLILWIGAILLFRHGRKTNSRAKTTLGASIAIPLTIMGLTIVIFFILGLIQISTPAVIFQRALWFDPPPEVTAIQSTYSYFGENGSTLLTFRAPPATIRRIVTEKQLLPIVRKSYLGLFAATHFDDLPKWWLYNPDPAAEYYGIQRTQGSWDRQDFDNEVELLTYDPATQTAHYAFRGWD